MFIKNEVCNLLTTSTTCNKNNAFFKLHLFSVPNTLLLLNPIHEIREIIRSVLFSTLFDLKARHCPKQYLKASLPKHQDIPGISAGFMKKLLVS